MELQVSAPDASSIGLNLNQHCWECRRRRLVCDSTRPVCRKCQAAKIVCPGYDEKQPLRWLKPGRVTCRTRKHKPSGNRKEPEKKGGNQSDSIEKYEQQDENQVKLITNFEMITDTCIVVQAAYYYISCVYQSVSPLHKIAQKYEQEPFSMSLLQYFPESQRHAFVSIAMGHRLYRLPEGTAPEFALKARSRTYQYRGMAIRALNKEISSDTTGASNTLIGSTITLLAADLQLSSTADWRFHFDGVVAMLKLYGGLKTIYRTIPYMKLVLVVLIILEGFGNTTSPRWNQSTAVTNLDLFDMVSEIYGDRVLPIYVGTLCPRALFMHVITINHLRRAGLAPVVVDVDDDDDIDDDDDAVGVKVADPIDILEDIDSFSPTDWVEGKATPATRPQWLLLACIHQSAVALYCILSLQGVGLLPRTTPRVAALDATHYERLLRLLERALAFPHLRHCATWPLVVAGIRAARSGRDGDRRFVAQQLTENARFGGTVLPLQAKALLARFWASGKTDWDDCFDRPYIFAA